MGGFLSSDFEIVLDVFLYRFPPVLVKFFTSFFSLLFFDISSRKLFSYWHLETSSLFSFCFYFLVMQSFSSVYILQCFVFVFGIFFFIFHSVIGFLFFYLPNVFWKDGVSFVCFVFHWCNCTISFSIFLL